MSATGLNPDEEQILTRDEALKVHGQRLNHYDRLMQEGGIEAVIQALEAERGYRTKT